MKLMFGTLTALVCLVAAVASQAIAQPGTTANALSFGGKSIAVDTTSCSSENSADGKNRAIAAINNGSASIAIVQFSTLSPASGTYLTVADEDALGSGKVVVGLAGSAFRGSFTVKPGQTIVVTRSGPRYQASFAEIAVIETISKAASSKRVTGNFGCQ